MNFVKLKTFDNQQEAYLVLGKLKNEGIDCLIQNKNFGTLMSHYSGIFGADFEIMVSEQQFNYANKLNNPQNVCSNFGSSDFYYGLGKNKVSIILISLVSLISWIPLRNFRVKMICNNCQTEFL